MPSFICSCCGRSHHETPFSFAADFPDNFAKLTLDERELRAVISSDQCIIDGREFYLRGCLELPILGERDPFMWGVWANLWEEDFDTIDASWEVEGRELHLGPFRGRLANSLILYPSTANLKLTVRIRPRGTRPLFVIDDMDHPLAQEQVEGISLETARRYSCLLLNTSAGAAKS